MTLNRPGPIRSGPPVSWQRVTDGETVLHGFRLDAGQDWRLAAACGRGPARGIFVDPHLPLCEECEAVLGAASGTPPADAASMGNPAPASDRVASVDRAPEADSPVEAPPVPQQPATADAKESPPDRPTPPPPAVLQRSMPRHDVGALLRAARDCGVTVEELDADHVRLRYDASVREQWLAIDDLIDAVDAHASLEGDGLFESAPDNWVAVHFDHGTCGRSRTPS